MVGQKSMRFIKIQQKGKSIVIILLVAQGYSGMFAIAKWIGAIVVLQNVEVFEILVLEPVGHDRVQAFLIVNNAVRFDDASPSLQH
jgi:hypothetical protein